MIKFYIYLGYQVMYKHLNMEKIKSDEQIYMLKVYENLVIPAKYLLQLNL